MGQQWLVGVPSFRALRIFLILSATDTVIGLDLSPNFHPAMSKVPVPR